MPAALALRAGFMAAMTVLVMLARSRIPELFLESPAAEAGATAALAATLLVVGGSFFIADGVQTIAASALRGLNDTRIPMLISALCFWVFGFAHCYVFGFPVDWGAVGVWIGSSLGVILYALLLVWRFHALTKRGYLPSLIPV